MPSTSGTTTAPAPAVHLARGESTGYQVNHLARLFEAALRVRIAPHGVAPGQFAQLLALFERDGVSQAELCDAVHIDQSTMVRTLRRMERDGLVSRVPSEQDRRRTDILLTEHARALEPALVACARDVNAVAAAGVDEADLATTHRVLAQMIANLQAAEDGAPS